MPAYSGLHVHMPTYYILMPAYLPARLGLYFQGPTVNGRVLGPNRKSGRRCSCTGSQGGDGSLIVARHEEDLQFRISFTKRDNADSSGANLVLKLTSSTS
jgi:hypothetical protein